MRRSCGPRSFARTFTELAHVRPGRETHPSERPGVPRWQQATPRSRLLATWSAIPSSVTPRPGRPWPPSGSLPPRGSWTGPLTSGRTATRCSCPAMSGGRRRKTSRKACSAACGSSCRAGSAAVVRDQGRREANRLRDRGRRGRPVTAQRLRQGHQVAAFHRRLRSRRRRPGRPGRVWWRRRRPPGRRPVGIRYPRRVSGRERLYRRAAVLTSGRHRRPDREPPLPARATLTYPPHETTIPAQAGLC